MLPLSSSVPAPAVASASVPPWLSASVAPPAAASVPTPVTAPASASVPPLASISPASPMAPLAVPLPSNVPVADSVKPALAVNVVPPSCSNPLSVNAPAALKFRPANSSSAPALPMVASFWSSVTCLLLPVFSDSMVEPAPERMMVALSVVMKVLFRSWKVEALPTL